MEKTEYTDKLAAAKDKVTKTMKQSIAELKEFIKKRDEFYSQNVKDMDFKQLEALGKEMEAIIDRAATALNAKEGVALIAELDRSVAKMRKVEDVQDKIRVAKAEENKSRVADMITDGQ